MSRKLNHFKNFTVLAAIATSLVAFPAVASAGSTSVGSGLSSGGLEDSGQVGTNALRRG